MTTQWLWACKKQNLGEWEIKNLSVQQIYDLICYDVEQYRSIQDQQHGAASQTQQPKITYEQALKMANPRA